MSGSMHLTDRQIELMLRTRSSEPHPGLARDIIAATSGVPQKRGWPRAMPGSRRIALVAAAVLLAALLIGGTLAVGGALRLPWLPSPAPTSLGWTGPLRSDAATMPLNVFGADGQDAEVAWIDIRRIGSGGFQGLRLELGGAPPPASTLDPTQTVIEYGVVLDKDLDRAPDCLIGINNDAPNRGDYRKWVTDLSTGATAEDVGAASYGQPLGLVGFRVDFSVENRPATCAGLGSGSLAFYAWASLTESGRVTAWDYAPDFGWFGGRGALP